VRLFRILGVVSVLLWHIASGWVIRFFSRDPKKLRPFFIRKVTERAKKVQRGLRIEPTIEGEENFRTGQNYLIVANHLSYLDAVLTSAAKEVAYVTSMEMRSVPFLGIITELGGCLYVERRSKDNIQNEISDIEEALRLGINVMVFPEATSTDGSGVKPFKRPLFAAAVKARVPVLPAVIQYESIDGKPVTVQNRDNLCWYGDMGFGSHFLKLTSFKEIRMRLRFLPEIPVTPESTRDSLMEQAYAAVSSKYKPIQ